MGNRGRLHDEARRIVRRVAPGYRAWVTCLLAFRGRHRPVMQPNRYTELFFLDEATALAAGHRPCGECRRADFRRFRAAWLLGNPDRGLGSDTSSARSTGSSTVTGSAPTAGPSPTSRICPLFRTACSSREGMAPRRSSSGAGLSSPGRPEGYGRPGDSERRSR